MYTSVRNDITLVNIDSCRSIMRHATFIKASMYIRNQLTTSFSRQGIGHRRIGRNNSKVNQDY